MAISVNTRKLDLTENLVLYVDFRWHSDGRRMESVLSEVHEESAKTFKNNYPLLPTTTNPILHSYGKRIVEWQATLALIDVLLGFSEKNGYRAALESRILAVKDRRPLAYTLCVKIRDQGQLQDPCKPESWLAQFLTCHPSSVVPENGNLKNTLENLKQQVNSLPP